MSIGRVGRRLLQLGHALIGHPPGDGGIFVAQHRIGVGGDKGAKRSGTGGHALLLTCSCLRSSAAVLAIIAEIATSIVSAVEEKGAATGEIARNVQQAARGTEW
jgi:hypothetical protein